MLPKNLFSKESVEASPWSSIAEGPLFTPGGTPSWASQPWHYVFQVSASGNLGMATYTII